MSENKSISNYPDVEGVTRKLDELIKKPIYSISPEILKKYESEYYDKKCAKSKAMIESAKQVESGLIARTWGNISCRIDEHHFLITPSGKSYLCRFGCH